MVVPRLLLRKQVHFPSFADFSRFPPTGDRRSNETAEELAILLMALQLACKATSRACNKASLRDEGVKGRCDEGTRLE